MVGSQETQFLAGVDRAHGKAKHSFAHFTALAVIGKATKVKL